MNDVRVESWNELNDCLFADAWKEGLRRYRSDYAFRGATSAAHDLTTSLMRLGGAYADLEDDLLRSFRKYAHGHSALGPSLWNWLALAQHHGLPTRLLDWSYSPYVALHFVTQDMKLYNVDGVVWCIDYVRAGALLPAALRAVLESEGSVVFTGEMLDRAAPGLGELAGLSEDPFPVFLEPPSLDERIVNQYALFSLMSRPEDQMDAWLFRHPELGRRVIIPAGLKWEVRDRLDQINMTERVLFPGLDGLSRWLRRYYSPRPDRVGYGREGSHEMPFPKEEDDIL